MAREIGIKTLLMEILNENKRMIKFGLKYDFKRVPDDDEEMVLEI